VAAPAVAASSATSVAVSNPRPKSTPTGYICQGLRIDRISFAEKSRHQPARVELLLEFLVVVAPAAHLDEDLDDADQDHQIEDGDQVEKRARDQRPDDPAEGRDR